MGRRNGRGHGPYCYYCCYCGHIVAFKDSYLRRSGRLAHGVLGSGCTGELGWVPLATAKIWEAERHPELGTDDGEA